MTSVFSVYIIKGDSDDGHFYNDTEFVCYTIEKQKGLKNMTQKNYLLNAISFIDLLQSEKYTPVGFIQENQKYFSGIPVRSLLPDEYIHDAVSSFSESVYIYLIGSYLYFNVAGEPVTWMIRRRFAGLSFSDDWNNLFRRTLSSSPVLRFQTLEELKKCLEDLLSATG